MSGRKEQKPKVKKGVGVKVSNSEPDFEANKRKLNKRSFYDFYARVIFGLWMGEVLDELHHSRYKEEIRKRYKPKLRRGVLK